MPRACLPQARFLASADSPLLPLLAPRVFAEALPERSKLQNDRRSQKEQEAETDDRSGNTVNKAMHKDGQHTRRCRESRLRKGLPASEGVLHASPVVLLSRSPSARKFPNISELRYADISTFARQQFRYYTTSGLENKIRNVEIAAAPSIIEDTSQSRDHRKHRRERPTRKLKHNTNIDTLFESRRQKSLNAEKRRMATYISHENSKKSFMGHGRYRSLYRRLFNFADARDTVVDLTWEESKRITGRQFLRALAALDRRVYPGIRRRTSELIIMHDSECQSWAARLFENATLGDAQLVWENWTSFDQTRETIWPYLLLYLLDTHPKNALRFVQVLAQEPYVKTFHPEFLADALEHLSKLQTRQSIVWSGPSLVPIFYHAFQDVLAPHRRMCSQDLLLNVATLADVEHLKRIFEILVESKTYILSDTALHYANIFAKAGEHQYALRCLKSIVQSITNQEVRQRIVNLKRFRWTCALILRKSMANGENYHHTTELVAAFVELGVKPDILLHNVLMRNAMEASDHTTAFQIYNALEENGLKPDKHTFSILLRGCTLANDPAKFHDFAEYCAQVANEIQDPWLAGDYLYYLYVRRHREDGDVHQAIASISHAYARFFKTDSVEAFSGSPTRGTVFQSRSSSADSAPMEPAPIAIYIMLQLEIRLALATSNHRVWRLYQRFKRLLEEQTHPDLNRLSQSPAIWNAFLLAFCRKQQFNNAYQIIKDMMHSSPQPNVFSWNIFMQSFFKTSQVQAAERVHQIMQSRGVEPDQYTYGVLLRGYAKAQHVEKIGEIMEHVDNEQQLDPQLLQSLSRVQNRRRLMLVLEQIRLRKAQREGKESEARAEREKKQWAKPSFSSTRPIRSSSPASASDKSTDQLPSPTLTAEAVTASQVSGNSGDSDAMPRNAEIIEIEDCDPSHEIIYREVDEELETAADCNVAPLQAGEVSRRGAR